MRQGQPLSLADDSGAVWQATVTGVGRDQVEVAIDERFDLPVPPVAVTLVQGLPKGKKMDEVVQHATEVGVDAIMPVVTRRCVKQPAGKDAKLQARWQAIIVAAAQQSRRARLPRLHPISRWPVAGLAGVIAWEQATTPLHTAVSGLVADGVTDVAVVVGPEGGLEPDEVTAESGLVPVSLGPTILRTETAGIVAPALVVHQLRLPPHG